MVPNVVTVRVIFSFELPDEAPLLAQPASAIAVVVAAAAMIAVRRSARDVTCHSFVVVGPAGISGALRSFELFRAWSTIPWLGALPSTMTKLWDRSHGCQGSAPTR